MAKHKRQKLCDPAICSCCQYVGEGDFLCDRYMKIVVSDWVPTEDHLLCEHKKRRNSNDE